MPKINALVCILLIFLSACNSDQTSDVSSKELTEFQNINSRKILLLKPEEKIIGPIHFLTEKPLQGKRGLGFKSRFNAKIYYTINNKKYGPFDSVDELAINRKNRKWGFAASVNNIWHVYINGKQLCNNNQVGLLL